MKNEVLGNEKEKFVKYKISSNSAPASYYNLYPTWQNI